MLSAAILIGGRARRMHGRFKSLLDVGGRSILMRQIDALRRGGVEHVLLIGRWPGNGDAPLPVVADAIEGAGSLGGVYTALLVAQGRGSIVLAGDMPFVEPELIERLFECGRRADAVVPDTPAGLQPLCAWYNRSLALGFKRRIERGDLKIREAVAEIENVHVVNATDAMLMNVNTTADYERACEAARHRT